MAEERINRKLAAILAADVVGYSRLMASDEAGTLAALKRHRQMVFEPAVAVHQGRIVMAMARIKSCVIAPAAWRYSWRCA
jgi:adenylate cyclase